MITTEQRFAVAIPEISELTEHNDHTEARILVATTLGNKELLESYERFQTLSKRVGYLEYDLSAERNEIDKKLKVELQKLKNFKQIWMSM